MNRKLWTWILLALVLSLALIQHVRAAQADDDEDDDDDVEVTEGTGASGGGATPDDEDFVYTEEDDIEIAQNVVAAPDIQTVVHFPVHPDKKFPLQAPITVLVGLHNKGDKTFNLSYVAASFRTRFDFSYVIDNFTAVDISNVVLPPHTEITVEYAFRPDKNLEPVEFWLYGWIVYNGTGSEAKDDGGGEMRLYRSTFYNSTIELVDRPYDVNVRRVFTYFFGLAVVGLAGFFGYDRMTRRKRGRLMRSATGGGGGSSGDSSDNSDVIDQWIPDSIASKNRQKSKRKL